MYKNSLSISILALFSFPNCLALDHEIIPTPVAPVEFSESSSCSSISQHALKLELLEKGCRVIKDAPEYLTKDYISLQYPLLKSKFDDVLEEGERHPGTNIEVIGSALNLSTYKAMELFLYTVITLSSHTITEELLILSASLTSYFTKSDMGFLFEHVLSSQELEKLLSYFPEQIKLEPDQRRQSTSRNYLNYCKHVILKPSSVIWIEKMANKIIDLTDQSSVIVSLGNSPSYIHAFLRKKISRSKQINRTLIQIPFSGIPDDIYDLREKSSLKSLILSITTPRRINFFHKLLINSGLTPTVLQTKTIYLLDILGATGGSISGFIRMLDLLMKSAGSFITSCDLRILYLNSSWPNDERYQQGSYQKTLISDVTELDFFQARTYYVNSEQEIKEAEDDLNDLLDVFDEIAPELRLTPYFHPLYWDQNITTLEESPTYQALELKNELLNRTGLLG